MMLKVSIFKKDKARDQKVAIGTISYPYVLTTFGLLLRIGIHTVANNP